MPSKRRLKELLIELETERKTLKTEHHRDVLKIDELVGKLLESRAKCRAMSEGFKNLFKVCFPVIKVAVSDLNTDASSPPPHFSPLFDEVL